MGGDSGSLKYPYIEAPLELMLLDGAKLFPFLSVLPEAQTVGREQRLRHQAVSSLAPCPSCHLGRALALFEPTSVYLSVTRDNISSSAEGPL